MLKYQQAKAVFFMEFKSESGHGYKKEEKSPPRAHTVTLKDREELRADGVTEVLAFDDVAVTAKTSLGEMTVEGKELRILAFDAAAGTLTVRGALESVSYREAKERKRSLFGK